MLEVDVENDEDAGEDVTEEGDQQDLLPTLVCNIKELFGQSLWHGVENSLFCSLTLSLFALSLFALSLFRSSLFRSSLFRSFALSLEKNE